MLSLKRLPSVSSVNSFSNESADGNTEIRKLLTLLTHQVQFFIVLLLLSLTAATRFMWFVTNNLYRQPTPTLFLKLLNLGNRNIMKSQLSISTVKLKFLMEWTLQGKEKTIDPVHKIIWSGLLLGWKQLLYHGNTTRGLLPSTGALECW